MLQMQHLGKSRHAWHSATKSFPNANHSCAPSTGLSHARSYPTPYSNSTNDQIRSVLNGFIPQPLLHLMAFLLAGKRGGDPTTHLTCSGFMAKDSIEEGRHPDASTDVRAHTYN